jgi:hypothetical protein
MSENGFSEPCDEGTEPIASAPAKVAIPKFCIPMLITLQISTLKNAMGNPE